MYCKEVVLSIACSCMPDSISGGRIAVIDEMETFGKKYQKQTAHFVHINKTKKTCKNSLEILYKPFIMVSSEEDLIMRTRRCRELPEHKRT